MKVANNIGNLAPQLVIYPNYSAPIVGNISGDRKQTLVRWEVPWHAVLLKGKSPDNGVTNVRITKSPNWRCWLSVDQACFIPFNSFSGFDSRVRERAWFAF